MSFIQSIILGVVQGITEFLPISSSGHLVLFQNILGLNDEQALKAFDIAVHFGTLLAIFIYFRKDFFTLIKTFFMMVFNKKPVGDEVKNEFEENKRMVWILIIGTIPAILVGLFFGDLLDELFLNPLSVCVMLVVVAFFFLIAENFYKNLPKLENISLRDGILIGIAQALALIPGVSRSGSTITTGLFLGIKREKAARFSFLLGSVAMLAATAYAVLKVYKGEYSLPPMDILATGVFSSFLAGIVAVDFLMKYLKNNSLAAFAYYRFGMVIFYAILSFYAIV